MLSMTVHIDELPSCYSVRAYLYAVNDDGTRMLLAERVPALQEQPPGPQGDPLQTLYASLAWWALQKARGWA